MEAYLAKLGPNDETFKAVVDDGSRKGLVTETIQAMLTMPNIVYPTRIKAKLKQTVKRLLTPDVARAVEGLIDTKQTITAFLSTPNTNVESARQMLKDVEQRIANTLSSLDACETTPTGPFPLAQSEADSSLPSPQHTDQPKKKRRMN